MSLRGNRWKKRSLRNAWVSVVDLGHYGTSLFISQNWSDFPIQAFRPLSSMLITSIGTICFDQNPTLNRARSMETFPWFALRERSTSRKEFPRSNFVISGFERPVHQKGHWNLGGLPHLLSHEIDKRPPSKRDAFVVGFIMALLLSSVWAVFVGPRCFTAAHGEPWLPTCRRVMPVILESSGSAYAALIVIRSDDLHW